MTDPIRALDRVRKLLALAGSPNLHEAALAAAQAQALIDRHRLDALVDEPVVAPITDGTEAPLERARRPRRWRGVLAGALAAANGCLAWSREEGGETALYILGRPADRAAVVALFEGLAPQIEWLSATHCAGRDRSVHEAFRVGAVEAVVERLRGGPVEPGLVRHAAELAARRAAVEEFAARRLGPGKGRALRVDGRAYAQGQAAGAGLALPVAGGLSRRGD